MSDEQRHAQGVQAGTYRELTVAAVVLGVLQKIVLNLAFVYAALKLGFSIGDSTVASSWGTPFFVES